MEAYSMIMIGACSRILDHEAVAKPRFSVQAIFLMWIIQGSVLLGLVLVFISPYLAKDWCPCKGLPFLAAFGIGRYEFSFFGRIS